MFAFCLRRLCVLWMSFKLSTILSSLQLFCVLGDPCNLFPVSGSQNHFPIIWGFFIPFSVLILFWRMREDWGRWGGGRGEESFHKWNSFKSSGFQLQWSWNRSLWVTFWNFFLSLSSFGGGVRRQMSWKRHLLKNPLFLYHPSKNILYKGESRYCIEETLVQTSPGGNGMLFLSVYSLLHNRWLAQRQTSPGFPMPATRYIC